MRTTAQQLREQVLHFLSLHDGALARDIGRALGVDKKEVNSVLYGPLAAHVRQDSSYRWFLRTGISDPDTSRPADIVDTPVARLSRYYLDCLVYDFVSEVGAFAEGRHGVDYHVVSKLDEPFASISGHPNGLRIIQKVRGDRNRLILYLGYLCLVTRRTARSGWSGNFVELVVLIPFTGIGERGADPNLSLDTVLLNPRALKNLVGGTDSAALQEAVDLSETLGLTESPDVGDLALRLRDIRPDWPWAETVDPDLLTVEAFSDSTNAGIYNRAVIISGERNPYTNGLESELVGLGKLRETEYSGTALGAWVRPTSQPAVPSSPIDLIEPIPLNIEQREAVRSALSRSLTVITGPPGTGKSQVVTAIVTNAAWHGQKVLLASKNNKAVDVVEQRTNGLGPRPLMVRLGSRDRQAAVASFLASYLSLRADKDAPARLADAKRRFSELRARVDAISQQMLHVSELRNDVDVCEREAEPARQGYGPEQFAAWRTTDLGDTETLLARLTLFVSRADRLRAPFLTRLFWRFVRRRRLSELNEIVSRTKDGLLRLGIAVGREQVGESDIDHLIFVCADGASRLQAWRKARRYGLALATLQGAPPLEQLARASAACEEGIGDTSLEMWTEWLRLHPNRLTPAQRSKLGELHAALELSIRGGEEANTSALGRKLQQELANASDVFSCWAVTSLSARGRVPFKPAAFDLVIIDEASQCDIASALPLLYRAKRAVIIGDPKQLRHISALPEKQDQALLEKHGITEGRLGWAYSVRSLFDLASTLATTDDIVDLVDHHRSHHDIIGFSNRQFYENRLRVATKLDRLKPIDETAVRWVHCTGAVRRPVTGGAENKLEAEAIVSELRSLLVRRQYSGTVGVVTPFRAQANLIREKVNADRELAECAVNADLLIDTVHKFQGDERDVMLFSTTVSQGTPDGALGFLRRTGNLFNVAITRARAALIVVGDRNAALNSEVDYLRSFAEYTSGLERPRGHTDHRVDDLGAHYPTVVRPETVSDWERVLYTALYTAGLRPIPQYSIDKYVLDFALFAGDRRLNIEVDGERYHRQWDGDLCRRDRIRNERMFELDWDVMRFWVYEVRDDLSACVDRVARWVEGSARG